jgi:hypothetical protein
MDLVRIQQELEDLTERKMDLIEKYSIMDSYTIIGYAVKIYLTQQKLCINRDISYLLDITKFSAIKVLILTLRFFYYIIVS